MAQAVRDQRCDIVKAPVVRCVCISQKHDVEVEVGAKLLKLFSAPRVLSGKRHMGNYFWCCDSLSEWKKRKTPAKLNAFYTVRDR